MNGKKIIIVSVSILLLSVLLTHNIKSEGAQYGGDLSEQELEDFLRGRTVSGNYAAAIKINFTVPRSGTAYLGTIHGYPDNLEVCEELIAPYNADPSMTVVPGSSYFCEELR